MKSNSELLRLAAKANQLATRLGDDVEERRLAARLVRNPEHVDALCWSTAHEAKYDGIFADALKTGLGLVHGIPFLEDDKEWLRVVCGHLK